jgi:hypothetical protein
LNNFQLIQTTNKKSSVLLNTVQKNRKEESFLEKDLNSVTLDFSAIEEVQPSRRVLDPDTPFSAFELTLQVKHCLTLLVNDIRENTLHFLSWGRVKNPGD